MFRACIPFRRIAAAVALAAACVFVAGDATAARPPKAYIVIDAASGRTLLSQAPDRAIHPASLTKMMTLYLLFDALRAGKVKMGTRIRFSRHAARQEPSKLGVRAGRSITVKTAIHALAIKSANDVAVAVAEKLGGSVDKFARRMNAKARMLGMARTNFVNPSGLHHPDQVSTARDMARLARGLRYKHRKFFHYFKVKKFRFAGRTYRSHNRFVKKYKGADGIKTGYVRASGFNLVGTAVRQGRRLIGVMVGGRSAARRDRDLIGVMNAGFRVSRKLGKPRYAGVAPVAVDWRTGAAPRPPRRGAATQAHFLAEARARSANKAQSTMVSAPRRPAELARTTLPQRLGPKSKQGDRAKGGRFSAQVGAVSSRRAAVTLAKRRLRDISRVVADAAPKVTAQQTGSGGLYRARIAGLTGKQARNACAVLKRAGRDCLVVSPG